MVVLVYYRIQQLRVMMLFDSEGFRHESRVETVLLGNLLELFHGFLVYGLLVDFFEIAQKVGWTFFKRFPFVFNFFNSREIREFDFMLFIQIFLHQSPPLLPLHLLLPPLLLLLLPLQPQPLLLFQPTPLSLSLGLLLLLLSSPPLLCL